MVRMDVPENYRLDRGALEVGSLKDKANDRHADVDSNSDRERHAQLVRQFIVEAFQANPDIQRCLECVARRHRRRAIDSEHAHDAVAGDAGRPARILPDRSGHGLDVAIEKE